MIMVGQIKRNKCTNWCIYWCYMKHMNSSTKLLVVVGDLVTRVISDYTHTVPKKPFEQLVFFNSFIGSIVTRPGVPSNQAFTCATSLRSH
ncbi:hypothetical protein Zmor_001355 [Zophobas morio]|uniref:Uncharacterized protein n=1 Tax=Zophobas morio TaxID=2755281 RepID=A0AA38J1J4_9CUCU|nr:hypothetical protein Zmor_001355 [Zophobas morio]